MGTFLQVLISATVGMLVGLLGSIIGEPLKLHLKSRKIEKQLYGELDYLYDKCRFLADPEENRFVLAEEFRNLKADVFEHYFNKEREAVFSVPGWQAMRETFDLLISTQEAFKAKEIEVCDAANQIMSCLENQIMLEYLKKEKFVIVRRLLDSAKSEAASQ